MTTSFRQPNPKIAIHGGSYNPLHNGHVIGLTGIVNSIDFARLHITELWIMPSGSGGRRDKDIQTNPAIRLEMARMLTQFMREHSPIPVTLSEFDIFRSPNLPTFHLWQLLKLSPEFQNTRFYFILGSDWQPINIRQKWVDGEKLVDPYEGAHFIIHPRQGYPKTFDNTEWPNFHWVDFHPEFIPPELSSSEIRLRCRSGQEFSHLVPPSVSDLIRRHQLYSED